MRPIHLLLAMSVVAVAATGLRAEEDAEGVVRLGGITPVDHMESAPHETMTGEVFSGEVITGGEYVEGCPGGCPTGGCGLGDPCRPCKLVDGLRCKLGHDGVRAHSPGANFLAPGRRPIWDVSLPYSNMWGAQWLGGPGGAHPSTRGNVYTPTDTTQLGYSYNHVPYWMPNPNMLPPMPIPDHFHVRGDFGNPCKRCGHSGGSGCPTGGCGVMTGSMMPASPTFADSQAAIEKSLEQTAEAPRLAPIPN